ncbi:MAG TPA: hypothetical protein ENH35_04005 [Candidatus Moranbacteria bacterium]|nr:hypothetical protein [Candidatus Moranbacteria bacterium]
MPLFTPLSIKNLSLIIIPLALTDFFDGRAARKWKSSEGMGKSLDSIADKVMIFSLLIFAYHKDLIDKK